MSSRGTAKMTKNKPRLKWYQAMISWSTVVTALISQIPETIWVCVYVYVHILLFLQKNPNLHVTKKKQHMLTVINTFQTINHDS